MTWIFPFPRVDIIFFFYDVILFVFAKVSFAIFLLFNEY